MKKSISVGNKKSRRVVGILRAGRREQLQLCSSELQFQDLGFGFDPNRETLLLRCRGAAVGLCHALLQMFTFTVAMATQPPAPQIKVAKMQNESCYSAACPRLFSPDRLLVGMAKPGWVCILLLQEEDRFGSPACPQLPPADTPPGRSRSCSQDNGFRQGHGRVSKRAHCWVSDSYQTAGGSTA